MTLRSVRLRVHVGRVANVVFLMILANACKTPQDALFDKAGESLSKPNTPVACRAYLEARAEYGAAVESLQGRPISNSEPPLRDPAQKMMRQADILSHSDSNAIATEGQGVIDALESQDTQAFGMHLTALMTLCEAVAAP